MNTNIYFDVLDTMRTGIGTTPEQAQEAKRYGQAELKLSVLRGWTPVVPETYGWDSAALLHYCMEEGDGASFRWLIMNGFIQIRLRNHGSLQDAALDGFQSPAYTGFGAWPELNGEDPQADRKAVVEALRTGKDPSALPDSIRGRLQALRQLSDAVHHAPPSDVELPRADKLRILIANAAVVARRTNNSNDADLLLQCTRLPNPNNRTVIWNFLNDQESRGRVVPEEVRNIVNAAFNVVAGECVGAARTAITIPLSNPIVADTLIGVFPDSLHTDLFESEPRALMEPSQVGDLELVRWNTVRTFLKDRGDIPFSDKERQAEAANLIAETVLGNRRGYIIATDWSNSLVNRSVAGAVTLAGTVMYGVPGGIIGLIAGLAGTLVTSTLQKAVKKQIQSSLKKKWLGIIRQRDL